jgi:hypothetical protein
MRSTTATLLFIFLLISGFAFSQEKEEEAKDSIEVKVDFANRYIWRGQPWGGDYPVVQPSVEYTFLQNWTVGFWATTNFKNDYFYPDGVTDNKGYREIDLGVSYSILSYLSVGLTDYYWPSVEKVTDVDNNYFNYGKDGVNTVDATVTMDLSELENPIPFEATLSTLVAGNDYRYDSDGNAKQNFTTYFEASYTFEDICCGIKCGSKALKEIDLKSTLGAVFNNQAQYYVSGDYDKVSVVNMGIELSKEISLGKNSRFSIPVSLSYIHNAATKNTEGYGKNFLLLGVSFKFIDNTN